MRKRFVFLCVVVCLGCAALVMAQEKVQTFSLGSKGQVQISTVSGAISVTGWGRPEVQVKSIVDGKNVEPEIIEKDGVLVIREKHQDCRSENHGSVNFEVMMPGAAELSAHSVSGKISCNGLNTKVSMKTVSGEVTADLAAVGQLSVASVSGKVECAVRQELSGSISAKNVSGDIALTLPRQVNARFEARSISGDIQGPDGAGLTKKDGHASHELSGSLGNGQGSVSLHTVSGNVVVK